ncbi:hypothetical protein SAMN04488003_12230 [Loktanella fryxellensis]|uniref:DUF2125 domain-containing protein n=1 Tax=Loktanella fryxellensis TaxID=245187 RepID=A0A1H8HU71_9RHOB|nr:DUF2125 domain-containing protein [Loktanella fryxellensis]SEN59545.1 hypothetical protein SAMN04488003_12230 [Loktanella fryxellensis]
MISRITLRAGVCLTALTLAPAAWADVTAQQVWTAWQEAVTGYATDVTLTSDPVVEDGDTVTVTNLVVSSAQDGDTLTLTIPELVFTGAGDGTVDVTGSDRVPVVIASADGGEIAMTLSETNGTLKVSGTPEALSYAMAADQYALTMDSLTTPEGPVTGEMRLAANGVSATTTTATGATVDGTLDLTATSVDLLLDITSPDATPVMVSGKIDGIAATGTSSMPADLDTSDPSAMFGGDYVADGTFSNGPSAYIIDVGGVSPVNGTVTTGPGTLSYGIGPDGLRYATEATDLVADLTSGDMPFPLRLTAASYGTSLTTPVGPTDAAVPFGLTLDLSELTVNDEVWAMLDPAASLPRDPATVQLDISGMARLDESMMDPAAMTPDAGTADATDLTAVPPMGPDAFPGEVESLTLNALTVDALGVSIDGTGDFTFDNADTTTFPGFPAPTGQITLDLTGANGLIDTLIAMGLVPEDQAMMGRMMMGMFATSVGDDALQSVIEVRDGQVLANGQRIR